MEAIGYDEIIPLLDKCGIKVKAIEQKEGKFNRCISFEIYDVTYTIIWYTNQSTLSIGDLSNNRRACIPFKWMFIDRNFPLFDRNVSLAFSYHKFKKESVFDREYPYECFRIPLEINEQSEKL